MIDEPPVEHHITAEHVIVEPRPEDRVGEIEELVAIAGGIARLATGAGLRIAWWGTGAYFRGLRRMAHAAVNGTSPGELLDDLARELRESLRVFLAASDEPVPAPPAELEAPAEEDVDEAAELRRLGEALLARSADVNGSGRAHPAYLRIVSELAPDEARILRLLCRQGPQPSVDVRSSRVPLVSSELVAPGLNMIGRQAGVTHLGRAPAYLNNLERLGLIWFSREPLPDPLDYQVLEAQPEVIDALKRISRGKTLRRSIHLTPFGEDFCHTVLPV